MFQTWDWKINFTCNVQETVFYRDIQTPRRELKYVKQRSIFDEIRGVWIADETLSWVFDISSQSKHKLRNKWRGKMVKVKNPILPTRWPTHWPTSWSIVGRQSTDLGHLLTLKHTGCISGVSVACRWLTWALRNYHNAKHTFFKLNWNVFDEELSLRK